MARPTVWVDLDNSPHIPFFNPIIMELEKRGIAVRISVRDYAQALALAEYYQLDYTSLGKHYGKNKFLKVVGMLIRSLKMIPFYFKYKPDLAFSHGSRSQFVFAKLFRIPTLVATDYEHSMELPFLKATMGIIPEVLPKQFAEKYFKKCTRYPGIKEDVYIENLKPDHSLLTQLGIESTQILVTVRPPATEAHYHTELSDTLFNRAMQLIREHPNTRLVILPRTKDQAEDIKVKWESDFKSGKMLIPSKVVDGLNLIWLSDLVLSGGGTMIREAAALKVPAYSIFGGEIGAVDSYLKENGRLILLSTVDDVDHKLIISKRLKQQTSELMENAALDKIVETVEIMLDHNSE